MGSGVIDLALGGVTSVAFKSATKVAISGIRATAAAGVNTTRVVVSAGANATRAAATASANAVRSLDLGPALDTQFQKLGMLNPAPRLNVIPDGGRGGVSSEIIHFGQRRVGPKFSADPEFPNTSGKTLDEVVQNLKNPNHPLTADDLPITAFRDPKTGLLVSQNTRTRAVLAEANLQPTKVDIVDLNSLSKRQRTKFLNRLVEEPVLPGNILPSTKVPVTPSMRDLTFDRVIEIKK